MENSSLLLTRNAKQFSEVADSGGEGVDATEVTAKNDTCLAEAPLAWSSGAVSPAASGLLVACRPLVWLLPLWLPCCFFKVSICNRAFLVDEAWHWMTKS